MSESVLEKIGLPKTVAGKKNKKSPQFKYPGKPVAMDGNTAAIMCERESTDAAGAYPITPSTQMGEFWADAAAKGHLNISNKPLIFIEPEGEHAAAAVTAGLSMTGLRASKLFLRAGHRVHARVVVRSRRQASDLRVLNIGARAMTKSTLNVHAGHNDYHTVSTIPASSRCLPRTRSHAADLNIIAHRVAEMALTPGELLRKMGFLPRT